MNQDWNDAKSQLQQCCLTLRDTSVGEPDIPVYKYVLFLQLFIFSSSKLFFAFHGLSSEMIQWRPVKSISVIRS